MPTWSDFREEWHGYLQAELCHIRFNFIDVPSKLVTDALNEIEIKSVVDDLSQGDKLLILILRSAYGHAYTPKNT